MDTYDAVLKVQHKWMIVGDELQPLSAYTLSIDLNASLLDTQHGYVKGYYIKVNKIKKQNMRTKIEGPDDNQSCFRNTMDLIIYQKIYDMRGIDSTVDRDLRTCFYLREKRDIEMNYVTPKTIQSDNGHDTSTCYYIPDNYSTLNDQGYKA